MIPKPYTLRYNRSDETAWRYYNNYADAPHAQQIAVSLAKMHPNLTFEVHHDVEGVVFRLEPAPALEET